MFSPIVRPRISERIDVAAAGRIIMIVAPAGYGKSLALSHWLAEQSRPHLRFDVQHEHNTLLGFARGMAEAFPQFPALRKTVATASHNSASAGEPGREMARWMAAHLEGFSGIIALDDFHRASDDVEISSFIAALVARTKSQVQWIVATRSTLDLPVATWLAYGDAHFVIGDRDLTFRGDEVLELSSGLGQELSPQALRGVMDATAGWPVALGLALRSAAVLNGGTDLSHATREVLFQYLAEQVYADLSTEGRDLLHFAAYLPSIDVDVLEVAGYHASARILEAVRRRATFLSVESAGVYKCHDLFREFLRRQIEVANPAEAKHVKQRAAASLERSGDVVAALRLYSELRATDAVLRLLRANGFDLMEHSHGDVVEMALQTIPADVRSSDPIILGLRAQRAADSGHFERAEALFKSALSAKMEPDVQLRLSIALAILLGNQSRSANDLLSSLDISGGRSDLRAEVAALLAVGRASSNDLESAREAIATAESLCSHVESPEARSKILLRLGIAKLTLAYDGEIVMLGLTEAAALAESLGMFGTAARAYNVLGMAQLFYLNAPWQTLESEEKSAIAAKKSADRVALQSALAYSISAQTCLGNESALESLLSQLSEAATSDARRAHTIKSYTRATICAWNGLFRDAAVQMDSLAASNYGYYDFDRLFNMACHALYAAAAGQKTTSRKLVSVAKKKISDYTFLHPYGTVKHGVAVLFTAMAECHAGRRSHARAILKMLPTRSPDSVALLRDALDKVCCDGNLSAGVEELIASVGSAYAGVRRTLEVSLDAWIASKKIGSCSTFALTTAERQILLALENGESAKEIAARTDRSIHTVRTLIQRASQKLGCNGRQETLAVARRAGLLARSS